jgi:hypothetical protein
MATLVPYGSRQLHGKGEATVVIKQFNAREVWLAHNHARAATTAAMILRHS